MPWEWPKEITKKKKKKKKIHPSLLDSYNLLGLDQFIAFVFLQFSCDNYSSIFSMYSSSVLILKVVLILQGIGLCLFPREIMHPPR